jgi:hypothetical protein
MAGGERLQFPYPLHPPSRTKVTVSMEPTLRQTEPPLSDSVYATCPEAQVVCTGWVTWVGGEANWPPDTVRLMTAPWVTDMPAEGLEASTVPAGD